MRASLVLGLAIGCGQASAVPQERSQDSLWVGSHTVDFIHLTRELGPWQTERPGNTRWRQYSRRQTPT